MEKLCKKCNNILSVDNFYKAKDIKDGYRNICKKCWKEYKNQWRENNRETHLQHKKNYHNRKKEDSLYQVKKRLRKRTYEAFRVNEWFKKSNTHIILGADFITVHNHIENLFTNGMSWERLGEIHIDHIIPLASATTEEELIKLCHYTNLQPLWAEDNLKKGCKII